MLCQIPPTVLPSALQLRVSWHIFPLCFCRRNFEQNHFTTLKTRDCGVDRASIFRCVGHVNFREQSPSLSFHRRPLPSQLTYAKKSSSDSHILAEDEVVVVDLDKELHQLRKRDFVIELEGLVMRH